MNWERVGEVVAGAMIAIVLEQSIAYLIRETTGYKGHIPQWGENAK